MDIFNLGGRVALITGAASGIGEATARLFASAGAKVLIVDIDPDRAQRVAADLPGSSPLICDITNEKSVVELFRSIDKLDILVNNAGIGLVGGISDTELTDFQRLMRVNVQGLFLVTRAAMPLLLASKGSIINIGSAAGLIGVKKRFAYCATKGAVVAMTRQMAVDYPTEIRVNCICPGTVESPFVDAYLEKYHRDEKDKVRQELHARQPLGRMGRPDEVASMALYLASPQAGFVNGSVLTIDGGWTAA